MTSRKNALRGFETEIERSREEANWKKAVELALQLKTRSPQHESLADFLIGEGKLEAYLEEWPPIKENMERAQRELSEARGFLTLATEEAGRRAGVALDAHLLLGKLHYACGAYDHALKHYKLAELDTLTEKELPLRSLRIVAESFAIKGLCLEVSAAPPAASRYKQAERDADMMRSFELASDLALVYLQRVGAAPGVRAGPTLETALQRVPLLHIRAQRLTAAIDRYREMLRAVEAGPTHALRLTLARQLAEVLMRGVTGQVWSPPAMERNSLVSAPPAPASTPALHAPAPAAPPPPPAPAPAPPGPWKPKKYTSINQFVPGNECEEVLLVLLVGEAMAVRDAVLSQSGEFEAARAHSLRSAEAVVDLLAVAATRWGQLCLVLESLERAMKFSFGCAHVWRQRALATAAAALPAPTLAPAAPDTLPQHPPTQGSVEWGACVRAAGVMRRAHTLCPGDAPLRLVAAATCYRMGWIEEGLAAAEHALRLEEAAAAADAVDAEAEGEGDGEVQGDGTNPMLARACLYVGLGHQLRAQKTNSRVEREGALSSGLAVLVRGARIDPNDHLLLYHLALHYAALGQLNDAMECTAGCLRAWSECGGGLRLAAALWSCAVAGGRGGRALAAARLARLHYPAADWPLAALASLQLHWDSGEAALCTGKELLTLVHLAEGAAGEEAEARVTYAELDARSDSPADDARPITPRDAASVRAEWVGSAGGAVPAGGGGRLERAASEGASSASGARSRPRRPRAAPRARAWLTLAHLCLRLGRASAAAGCVSEAAALTPFSHHVLHTRGLVHAAGGEWEEARACFQNALAIHPTHIDSIVHLGAAYYELGWLRLSEKCLREACALCPRRADPWRRLALVLCALGEPHAAADAAAAALALHPHEPHIPLPL